MRARKKIKEKHENIMSEAKEKKKNFCKEQFLDSITVQHAFEAPSIKEYLFMKDCEVPPSPFFLNSVIYISISKTNCSFRLLLQRDLTLLYSNWNHTKNNQTCF